MSRGIPLPPGLERAPFRVGGALEEVSWGRLRRLPSPFHGVRSGTEPRTLLDRATALHEVFRATDCFSHLTAAALIGLRVPEGRGGHGQSPQKAGRLPPGSQVESSTDGSGRALSDREQLHVTTLGPGRAMRRPGVLGHVARHGRRLALSATGLVVTDPIDTWVDLAATSSVEELVAIGDGPLARRRPLASMEELERAMDAGRAGVGRLRQAIRWIRPGTDSWRETMLRLALVRRGVPEPEVNGQIVHDGRVIAHGDLVWRDARLIVEYEGRQHWDDDRQFRIDIERINRLVAGGWRHVRVDKHLLAAPDRLAHDVLSLM